MPSTSVSGQITYGDAAPIFRGGRGRQACFLSDRPNNVAIELTESEPSR